MLLGDSGMKGERRNKIAFSDGKRAVGSKELCKVWKKCCLIQQTKPTAHTPHLLKTVVVNFLFESNHKSPTHTDFLEQKDFDRLISDTFFPSSTPSFSPLLNGSGIEIDLDLSDSDSDCDPPPVTSSVDSSAIITAPNVVPNTSPLTYDSFLRFFQKMMNLLSSTARSSQLVEFSLSSSLCFQLEFLNLSETEIPISQFHSSPLVESFFSRIPSTLLFLKIFYFLDNRSLFQAFQVCKRWSRGLYYLPLWVLMLKSKQQLQQLPAEYNINLSLSLTPTSRSKPSSSIDTQTKVENELSPGPIITADELAQKVDQEKKSPPSNRALRWIYLSHCEIGKAGEKFSGIGKLFGSDYEYQGEIKDGKREAFGTTIHNNGNWHRGEYKNNKRNGMGLFIWPDNSRYEGSFVDDYRHGEGTYIYPNGSSYSGQWKVGQKHGKGKYSWHTGDVYFGDYVNDKRTGRGKLQFSNGDYYEGDFKEFKRTGKGHLIWKDGSKYTGDFLEDKRTGRGSYDFPSGAKYEGDFVEDRRTGQGVHTFPDGAIYTGGFLYGKKEGAGSLLLPDGRKFVGKFSKDKIVSSGVLYSPDNSKIDGLTIESPIGVLIDQNYNTI